MRGASRCRSEHQLVSRRAVLRAAGISLALPALAPCSRHARASSDATPPPRRMVVICTPLGLIPRFFFPEQGGMEFELTPYLEVLSEFRRDFTVISGLSHPEVGASHDSLFSFLTAAPHPEIRGGFRNSISMDQVAAEQIGEQTRFACLSLSAEGFGLSWTRSGALVPPDLYPASLFSRLFLDGRPEEIAAQKHRLQNGQSILDRVRDRAQALHQRLGTRDREKLEEYFTSVRELERRMTVAQEWLDRPKPKVNAPPPQNNMNPADLIGKTQRMFDLIHLALQTDSTRIVTLLLLGTSLVPPIPGVSFGHHDLSHHGQDSTKIEQLKVVELEKLRTFRAFLQKLKETQEGDGSLLDQTMVLFGSNLGNASNHSTKNLPLLLAGGGFRHGGHLAFDPASPPPLSNLYVTMLQQLGLEVEQFGSSTGTLTGL